MKGYERHEVTFYACLTFALWMWMISFKLLYLLGKLSCTNWPIGVEASRPQSSSRQGDEEIISKCSSWEFNSICTVCSLLLCDRYGTAPNSLNNCYGNCALLKGTSCTVNVGIWGLIMFTVRANWISSAFIKLIS
jgi:hypothetical protein